MSNVPIYMNQGGTELTIGADGTLTVEAGATVSFADADAVDDLGQDISNTYVEAEVQAISDKVDELLASLRAAGILPTS